MSFTPNYKNIEAAARNDYSERLPLYEHVVSVEIMEAVLDKKFKDLRNGDWADKKEFFRLFCQFYKKMGYDAVSFEGCVGNVMPDGGALGGHKEGAIKCRKDFEEYPWHRIHDLYFEKFGESFELLREVMPEGMKAVGGVGNGLFECVQDLVGYQDLCLLSMDDPMLYDALFQRIMETNLSIWKTFLERYADVYCVCRFGDDMGYKTSTLLPPEDLKRLVVPRYKTIIDLIHSYDKPFLLHSCGCIFDIMEDLIEVAGIDAKHSNEDVIAPFSEWVDKYGERIGNFGGIDTDAICQKDTGLVKRYVEERLAEIDGKKGIAVGSGNSIPSYVNLDAYMTMNETIRSFRGE